MSYKEKNDVNWTIQHTERAMQTLKRGKAAYIMVQL